MLQSSQSAKKAKKANKKSKSGGKKLNRFFNLVGGGENNTKKAETEEYSIEANTAGGNGRKTTNEFYLSKINALEKVLTEMRKKKKKAERQSQECRFVFQNHSSQSGESGVGPAGAVRRAGGFNEKKNSELHSKY